MNAFRLCRHDRISLDGVGGLYTDGRWHRRGSRIVYSASTISLAVLESRVHHETAPLGWVALELLIPDELVEKLDQSLLPAGWSIDRTSTQDIGETWLQSKRSAVLGVPSVIVPTELNFLLNPLHPEAPGVAIKSMRPFVFDTRLFRSPGSS